VSARGLAHALALGALAVFSASAVSCGHVDPGEDFQFAQVVYDQNYFYCNVEPMLFAQNCGPGESGTDVSGGCHYNYPRFHLSEHDPIPCSGSVPTGAIPSEAQANFQAAAREMTPDGDRSPLLMRPTKQAAHPRKIFEEDSAEAKVVRDWAEKFTSR
jgi:hypothetical protein